MKVCESPACGKTVPRIYKCYGTRLCAPCAQKICDGCWNDDAPVRPTHRGRFCFSCAPEKKVSG